MYHKHQNNTASYSQYEPVFNPATSTSVDQALRMGFVRKVYGILSLQLVATAVVCYLSLTVPAVRSLVNVLQLPTTIGMIVTLLWLNWSKTASKEVPKNYFLLGTFTICESFALSGMIQFVPGNILATAFFFTAGVTVGLTLYAMTTKKDLTKVGATGSILLSAFSILIWVNLFFRVQFIFTLYLVVGVVAYGYYLVHHTQAIIGGKSGQVDLDDYIKAAMTLYIDIVQLFIKIVRILQQLQESEEEKKKNRK